MDEESQEKRIEQKWVPLEANPEIWNKIIHKNGVDPRWNYVDVYGNNYTTRHLFVLFISLQDSIPNY
ncbi:Putative Ubiquitin carboxyl-terminal hydrolase L3 [Rhizopus microsporus]|nr:Putative Ubiquitin carboxyl-terminal hydrolase L3 [Rhizopus microsporus]